MNFDAATPMLPEVATEFTIEFQVRDDRVVRKLGISDWQTASEIQLLDSDRIPTDDADLQALWDRAEMRNSRARITGNPRERGNLRYVDLFAGCGGLSYGVQQVAEATGYGSIAELAVDLDSYALNIYRRNIIPRRCEVADLSVDMPSIDVAADLLIGGPPCQGHSNLNNHTRRLDERDELYLEMPKFAAQNDIPLVAIENVPAVVSSHKSIVERARDLFNANGYQVDEFVMDASKLGVAQTRKRHFMFASSIGMPDVRMICSKLSTNPRPLSWAIDDLRKSSTSYLDKTAELSETNRQRIRVMFENGWFNLPNEFRPPSHRNGHSYNAVYGRMRWDSPASTITTRFVTPGCGRFIHPLEQRTLTLHEGARVQGFPDSFDFLVPDQEPVRQKLTRVIGNAVPPRMGFVVGIWAICALEASR